MRDVGELVAMNTFYFITSYPGEAWEIKNNVTDTKVLRAYKCHKNGYGRLCSLLSLHWDMYVYIK